MNPLDYVRKNTHTFLDELKAFLSIPSISTQIKHQPDIQKAAGWLRDRLRDAGIPRAEVLPTAGHPVVYGEWLVDSTKPTVLLYGHYDVQPADPFNLWRTPPFLPTIVGDDIVARGASDDKGQLFAHVKALQAFKATDGAPPVNIKCIFEGEEEVGSMHLDPFIMAHKDLLAADVAVISDSHILGKDLPSILYALRGLAYVEVEVAGPENDLHSGIYGGAVHNPINALCAMIARLQDEQGHITIPGFYDKVRDLEPEERAELAKVPFDREAWLQEAGVTAAWGEPEYTIVERTTSRPTLDVNGIWGGYIEPGAKTVLPGRAYAKISMRLVPDQDPKEVARLVSDYLKAIAPPTVRVAVRNLHGGKTAMVPRDHPALKAAFRAYTEAFGNEPVFMREGGSIPVVASLQTHLGIETVLMGFGLPDDNLHAPNEKLHLPNFFRGIETAVRFYQYLSDYTPESLH
ncbi:MAG: dipeptidase [Anaerolineae bacterium]|nr:dipeptidase [Anaerolineae bacterium]